MRTGLTCVALAALLAAPAALALDAATAGRSSDEPFDREHACEPAERAGTRTSPPPRYEQDQDGPHVPLGTGVVVSPTAVDVLRPLQAGDVFTCVVTIRNRRTVTTTFDLEPTGLRGVSSDDVGVEYLDVDHPDIATTAAGWITPQPATVRLPPRGVARVPVTVRVPADPPAGAAYAALQVSPRLPRPDAARGAPNLGIDARIAVPFLLRVGGSGEPQLRLLDVRAPRVRWSRASWTWRADLENVGTLHASPRGRVRIRSIFGGTVATLPLTARTLLPHGRARLETTWSTVPWFGLYRHDARVAATGEQEAAPARASGWFVALPPPWVMALAGALLLAWLLRRLTRRPMT